MNSFLKKFIKIKFSFLISLTLFEFGNFKKALADINQIPGQEYIRDFPQNNFYILGPGDVLNIEVNDYTLDLNNVLPISGEGFIKLKGLKKIYVKGLTISELSNILNQEYLNFVKYPDVDITILKYRPIKIYIQGEVEETGLHVLPGSYNLKVSNNNGFLIPPRSQKSIFNIDRPQNLDFLGSTNSAVSENVFFPTLFDAIKKSNGITLNADLSQVKIVRKNSISNGGGSISTTVNLLDTINQKDDSQNIRLMDGDNIFIARSDSPSTSQITKAIKSNLNPKFINVYFAGRVENAGIVQLNKTAALTDALNIVGPKVLKGPIRFLRYNSDGSIDVRKFGYRRKAKRGSYKNPILKDGDIVYITKSSLNLTTEVLSEITAPFQGILSSYTLYKAFSNL